MKRIYNLITAIYYMFLILKQKDDPTLSGSTNNACDLNKPEESTKYTKDE